MRRLGVLMCLFIVSAGLWLALGLLESPPPSPPAETAPPAEEYRMLYQRSQQDFAAMEVVLASGESYRVSSSLVFDADGRLLGVNNQLGQPITLDGQADFVFDTISYQMMLLTAANLPVTASYPGLEAAACGLDTPAAHIRILYRSGDEMVLRIGRRTATGYSCYVAMEGDDSVHLVPADFFEVMTKPLKEHHYLPGALNASSADALQVAVVPSGDSPFIATRYETEADFLPWRVEQPIVHAGSTERIEAFAEALCEVHAEAYETTVYGMEGLAAYGLDTPTRLLAAFSDGVIRDLHIGSDAGSGMVYVRMDSTGDIYLASREQFRNLLDPDALLDRFVALVPAASLAWACVQTSDDCWKLEVSGEERMANDRQISRESFGRCYTAMIGLQFARSIPQAAAGETLAEIEYHLMDGTETQVVFYPCDLHYVQAVTSGGGSFLVRCEQLEDMLTILKEELP